MMKWEDRADNEGLRPRPLPPVCRPVYQPAFVPLSLHKDAADHRLAGVPQRALDGAGRGDALSAQRGRLRADVPRHLCERLSYLYDDKVSTFSWRAPAGMEGRHQLRR